MATGEKILVQIKQHPAWPLLAKLAGRVPRALLVGGSVRDALLGIVPADLDAEVFGLPALKLEILLEELFPGQVKAVGKSFGVFKVGSGLIGLDVSLPRRESKSGQGHRDFLIKSDPRLSVEQASQRRDFTINAMAIDARTAEWFDFFRGAADLQNHVLRAVDPMHFPEDPLRVYRALQFVARFELVPEPETKELLRKMVADGQLEHLSRDRIKQELKKLEAAAHPELGWQLAEDLGIKNLGSKKDLR